MIGKKMARLNDIRSTLYEPTYQTLVYDEEHLVSGWGIQQVVKSRNVKS